MWGDALQVADGLSRACAAMAEVAARVSQLAHKADAFKKVWHLICECVLSLCCRGSDGWWGRNEGFEDVDCEVPRVQSSLWFLVN